MWKSRDLIWAVELEVIWTIESLHGVSGIGDRDFEMSKYLDNEKPEITICNFAMESQLLDKKWFGPLITTCIGLSGIGISLCKEHNATKTPISRYAKSRLNPDRHMQKWSGPLIWPLIGVSGIAIWKWQELATLEMLKSWYTILRYNRNRWDKIAPQPLIKLYVGVSRIRIW